MDLSEALILFGCYVLNWLALFLLVKKSRHKRGTVVGNLLAQICYTLFFWINLSLPNPGGTALVWIIFWPVTIGMHFAIMMLSWIALMIFRRRG